MKEHRMKALRVTTTNNINRDGSDMFSSLQLLRLELELRPSTGRPMTPLRCLQQDQQRLVCCSRLPHHHHHHIHQDQKSSNSVLQECLSCENVPMIDDLLITATTDIASMKSHQKCECDSTSTLHMTCGLPTSAPFLHKLCSSNGCDIGRLFASSQASLQLLLTGDLQGNWSSIVEAVKLLATIQRDRRMGSCRERHFLLSMTDSEGNTPLLIAGRRLLREGAFDRAAQLSRLLLEAGSDPNAANTEGRSLLTYSVHYMDESIELTRVLLNGGASVWPLGTRDASSAETMENASSIEQCSAFTWFLRSVIRRRKLDEQCERTLALLSQVMGEHPGRMHGHVMRTMFRHAKCYKVLGPVFYQLKISMMRYWTQPQDLLFMCRKAIRSALGPERLMAGETNQLGLPNQIQGYLLLE